MREDSVAFWVRVNDPVFRLTVAEDTETDCRKRAQKSDLLCLRSFIVGL